MKSNRIFLIAISLLISAMIFQNCGQFRYLTEQTVTGSCAIDMQPTFRSTYYSFFQENECNRCHAFASNLNVPVFADSDPNAAYNAFLTIGPAKVDSILSVGHNGYSYTALKPELNLHFEQWFEAKESCNSKSGSNSVGQSISFFNNTEELGRFKVQQDSSGNAINTKQKIVFDLGDSSFSSPIAGVTLSFDIEVHYDFFFYPTHYEVSNPRISSTQKSIQLEGLTILLNGKSYQVTTFTGISEQVPKGTNDFSLDPGGATTFFVKEQGELYSNADEWSIQLEVFVESQP